MSVILEPASACHLLSFCYLAKMIFSEYSCRPDMNGWWAAGGLRPGSLRPLGLDLRRDKPLCCCWTFWINSSYSKAPKIRWGTIAGVVRWCKIFFTFQFSDRCGVHLACRESSIPVVFLLIIALCLALMQTQTTLFISTVSLWHYNAILLWVGGGGGWVGVLTDLLINHWFFCWMFFVVALHILLWIAEGSRICLRTPTYFLPWKYTYYILNRLSKRLCKCVGLNYERKKKKQTNTK